MDPIHQFEIKALFPIAHIGATEIAFTNSALFMLIGLAVILLLTLGATRSRALYRVVCRQWRKSPTNSS